MPDMHTDNRLILAAEREAKILAIEAGAGWANEDKMQENYYQWAHNLYPESKYHLWHVPNGGTRNKAEAMKFVAMGMRAGIPDLILIKPVSMVAHGIELKVRGKRQSDKQKECQLSWGAANYTLIVEDFLAFKRLIEWAFLS